MVKVMVCIGLSKQDMSYSRPAMSENSIWECSGCEEIVPRNFDVCWNCGMSREGVADPKFVSEIAFHPQCTKCGYLLIGLMENRCPECGEQFDPTQKDTAPALAGNWVMADAPGRQMRMILALASFCRDRYLCGCSSNRKSKGREKMHQDNSGGGKLGVAGFLNLGNRIGRRRTVVAAISAIALVDCTRQALHAATQTSTWVGGSSSNWSAVANWSPANTYPNNGNASISDFNVVINAVTTPDVSPILDVPATIDDLALGTGASLTLGSTKQ